MKRILIASAVAFAAGGQAFAADLPPPMAPPPRAPAMYVPVVPLYNWTGFYIGGNLGAGWNSTGSITDTFGSTFGTTTNTSFLGGGQVGVNYEFGGGVVVGAEAMFDWLPNTSNTINATGAGAAAPRGSDNQQSLADDRDRQARLRLGSRASLWQGRWCVGRHQQSSAYGQWRTGALLYQQRQQLWLDCRSRR